MQRCTLGLTHAISGRAFDIPRLSLVLQDGTELWFDDMLQTSSIPAGGRFSKEGPILQDLPLHKVYTDS